MAPLYCILCLVRLCSDWSEEQIEASDWLLTTAVSLQHCSAQVSRLESLLSPFALNRYLTFELDILKQEVNLPIRNVIDTTNYLT